MKIFTNYITTKAPQLKVLLSTVLKYEIKSKFPMKRLFESIMSRPETLVCQTIEKLLTDNRGVENNSRNSPQINFMENGKNPILKINISQQLQNRTQNKKDFAFVFLSTFFLLIF